MEIKKNPIKTICVYMGAFDGGDPIYKEKAIELGHELGKRGYRMVYGGAKTGLMYEIARAAQEENAYVIGVMPQTLIDGEVANYDCDEWYAVENMHERKALMNKYADAFIVFPGGFGTLEEMAEIITWNQLDIVRKPMCVLNINGYWTPFLSMIDYMKGQGFIRDNTHKLFSSTTEIDTCFDMLETQDLSPIDKWKKK